MISPETRSIIERGKKLYAQSLQAELEADHINRYVAIEPDSGDYFLADTFDEAVRLARAAHPNRISYTARIGHPAALTMGVLMP